MSRNGGVARREEHAEDTRRAILSFARQAFAENGYADTSLDDIVGRARLTKGALYHHFKSKAQLLQAVYVQMEEELVMSVAEAARGAGDDPWERLGAALEAFFDGSAKPAYVRIVLRDAPPVLGHSAGRQLDQAIGLGFVCELVSGLQAEGLIPPLPVLACARIILAAASEVAVTMASSDDPARARVEGTAVMIALLEGLRLRAAAER